MLLNVGHNSDGTIPDEQRKILLCIGEWLDVKGKAIYGTRPWVTYREGATRIKGDTFSEKKGGCNKHRRT